MKPLFIFLACLLSPAVFAAKNDRRDEGRFLSIFNSVHFNNEECTGKSTDGSTGTCVSFEECKEKGGIDLGTCAAGFGTCCQSVVTECGSTIDGNCTYIQNEGFPQRTSDAQAGCVFTLQRIDSDICFIRLDFDKLEVARPDPIEPGVLGLCTIDMVTFTQGNGFFAPTLCGINNGQHMYLDAGGPEENQDITITHAFTGTDTMRLFRYKVTQIPCGTPTTPDQGCLQYYTGLTGRLESFNFQGQYHLTRHFYAICIRRERNKCRFQLTPSEKERSFKLEGVAEQTRANAGTNNCRNDFVMFPQAVTVAATTCSIQWRDLVAGETLDDVLLNNPDVDRLCGSNFNCIAMSMTIQESVVGGQSPFNIYVNIDHRDPNTEEENFGFSLDYLQLPC